MRSARQRGRRRGSLRRHFLLEQSDEWAVQRGRYMTLETIAPLCDGPAVSLPAIAGERPYATPRGTILQKISRLAAWLSRLVIVRLTIVRPELRPTTAAPHDIEHQWRSSVPGVCSELPTLETSWF
jgi:hypothetical protein